MASSRRACAAFRRRTPLPARTSGRVEPARAARRGRWPRRSARGNRPWSVRSGAGRRRPAPPRGSRGARCGSGPASRAGRRGTPCARSRARRRLLDALVPLRHGLEHAHDVDELVRLLVELVEPGLAGDRDHRRVVEVRVGDAGHEVGGTRAEGRHRHRRSAGQAAVDVGHERGALLVAGRDVADRGLRLSASRTSIVSSPGTEKTYSQPSAGEALDEQRGGRSAGLGGHGRQSTVVVPSRSLAADRAYCPMTIERCTLLRLAAFTTDPRGGNPAGVWIGEALPDRRGDAARSQPTSATRRRRSSPLTGRAWPGDTASATSARWPRSRSAATRRSPAAWPLPSADSPRRHRARRAGRSRSC